MGQPLTTTTTTVTQAPTLPTIAPLTPPQVVQIASGTQNIQVANAVGWYVDDDGNLNLVNATSQVVSTFAVGQWSNVQIVG